MALLFRPVDRFPLRLEGSEHVVRVIFDSVIVDGTPLRAALRPRFNVDVRHDLVSLTERPRPEPNGGKQFGSIEAACPSVVPAGPAICTPIASARFDLDQRARSAGG